MTHYGVVAGDRDGEVGKINRLDDSLSRHDPVDEFGLVLNPGIRVAVAGTPKGRLTRLEKHLVAKPWQEARPGAQVKLLPQQGELDVLAQSRDRVAKER